MTINLKRIYKYLFYASAGLFNLLFMIMNYAVLFISAEGESETKAFSAYGCMKFGDESLGNMLTKFIEGMGKDPHLTFLTVFISIIMILLIIVSAVLLLAGVAGLVKELAKVNILGPLDGAIASRVSSIAFTANFIMHVVSAVLLILTSLINLYSGEFFGVKISMGMRPGLGMYFLLVLAVGTWVAVKVLAKKLAKPSAPTEKTVYKCPACEHVSEAEVKFCPMCGAEVASETVILPAEEEQETEAVDFDFKKVVAFVKNVWAGIPGFLEKNNISKGMLRTLGIALGAVLVLLIVFAVIPRPQIAAYVEPESSISSVYDNDTEKTVFVIDGKLSKHTLDTNVLSSKKSIDGSTLAIYDNEKTLYVFTKKGIVEVDENVKSYVISAEGKGIAYVNEDGELMLYNVAKKNAEKVSDEISEFAAETYFVSPDGKTVAFIEGTYDDFDAYVSVNGKKEKIGNKIVPIGVSNKGKFVYYLDMEKNALYVQKKGKDAVKLMNDVVGISSFRAAFNVDHTEIFYTSGDSWYLSVEGKEKVKISAKNIEQFGNYDGVGNTLSHLSSTFRTIPVETFAKQYFLRSDGDLCYINKKLESVTVAEDVDGFLATPSYDVIYYVDNGTIYRGEGYKDKFKKVADDDAEDMVITRDGNACYYINEDDELMYVKKTGKAKKIADDASDLEMTHDGYALFLTDYSAANGGTLCYSKNGGKKKVVSEDVSFISIDSTGTYYTVRSDDIPGSYELYGTKNKVKFKLLVKGAIG